MQADSGARPGKCMKANPKISFQFFPMIQRLERIGKVEETPFLSFFTKTAPLFLSFFTKMPLLFLSFFTKMPIFA